MYRNFFRLLYRLKSANFNEDFHFGNKKNSAEGYIWRVRLLRDSGRVLVRQKCVQKLRRVSRNGSNLGRLDPFSVLLSKSGATNIYRLLLLGQLHGELRDDFDGTQQELSQRDHCPLMWNTVQIWDRLPKMLCPT